MKILAQASIYREAIHLSKAAEMIRQDMVKQKSLQIQALLSWLQNITKEENKMQVIHTRPREWRYKCILPSHQACQDGQALSGVQRRGCWKMTVSCSQDYSCPISSDSVTCKISSSTRTSDFGKLHSCQKSQLTEIIQTEVTIPDREPEWDVMIIDGSALINYVPSKNEARTFCQRWNHMA